MEVKEIQGYWNHNFVTNQYSYVFNGQILIEEDGWFEGYIKQANFGQQNGDIGFVFGVYQSDRILELFYCVNDFIYRFQMYQKENRCLGHYSSIGPVMEQVLGQCKIMIKNATVLHETEVFAKTKLSQRFMSMRGKDFYQKLCDRRKDMIAVSKLKSFRLDTSFQLLSKLLEQTDFKDPGYQKQK